MDLALWESLNDILSRWPGLPGHAIFVTQVNGRRLTTIVYCAIEDPSSRYRSPKGLNCKQGMSQFA